MNITKLFSQLRLNMADNWLVWSIFFLTPLFYTGTTFQGLGFDKFFIFTGLLCLTLAFRLIFGASGIWFSRTKFDLPIALLVSSGLLSLIFSRSFVDSMLGSFGAPEKSMLAIICFAILFYLLANSSKAISSSFWALVSTYVVISFAGIFSHLGFLSGDLFVNIFGSNRSAGQAIIMTSPLFFFAIWKLTNFRNFLNGAVRILLAISLCSNLAILAVNKDIPHVSSIAGQHWQIISGGIKENFIFGTGPGTYDQALSKYRQVFDYQKIMVEGGDKSTTLPILEIFLTLGLLGTTLLGYLLYSGWHNGKSAIFNSEGEAQVLNIALISSSVIFFALMFTEISGVVYLQGIMIAVTTAAAINLSLSKKEIKEIPTRAGVQNFLAGGALIIIAVILVLGSKYVTADLLAKKASQALMIEEKIMIAQDAVNLASFRPEYVLLYAENVLNKALLLMTKEDPESLNDFRRAFTATSRAIVISPNNSLVLIKAGLIFESIARADATAVAYALQTYNKLVQIEPNNAYGYYHLGLTLEASGNLSSQEKTKKEFYDNAIMSFDKVLGLYPNFVEARLAKARVMDRMGLYDEAIASIRAMLAINPLPEVKYELARRLYNRGVSRKGQIGVKRPQVVEDISRLTTEAENNNSRIVINKDISEALALLTEITAEYPRYANAIYTITSIEYRLGKTKDARLHLNTLLELLSPKDQNAVRTQFTGL